MRRVPAIRVIVSFCRAKTETWEEKALIDSNKSGARTCRAASSRQVEPQCAAEDQEVRIPAPGHHVKQAHSEDTRALILYLYSSSNKLVICRKNSRTAETLKTYGSLSTRKKPLIINSPESRDLELQEE